MNAEIFQTIISISISLIVIEIFYPVQQLFDVCLIAKYIEDNWLIIDQKYDEIENIDWNWFDGILWDA